MTSRAMSATQIARYTKFCEGQGIRVTRTKKGLLLRFPNGDSTVQHFTTSDVKAVQNQIAIFRRAGMVHPDDPRGPKDLPSYITSGSISAKTKQRIITLIRDEGFPDSILSSTVVKKLGMDPGWANRALYHSGFRPGPPKSRKIGRPWYTPDDILALKDAETRASEESQTTEQETATPATPEVVEVAPVEEKATFPETTITVTPPSSGPSIEHVAPQEQFEENQAEAAFKAGVEGAKDRGRSLGQAMKDTGMIPPAHQEQEPVTPAVLLQNGREILDSHDSWVIEPEVLFGHKWKTFMGDELRVLKALGIEYEIRVWRTR